MVGGGIVVCLVLGESWAQPPGQGRQGAFSGARPLEPSGWLHINEAGQITIYTGKVELGQDIRTSLSQVVAEELRLPMAANSYGHGGHRAHQGGRHACSTPGDCWFTTSRTPSWTSWLNR